MHLCFAAAVIHLIDVHPTNPARNHAIRHLRVCVDALQDLRTPWCAWATRFLRGVRILALDWYDCDDISQLQEFDKHDHKRDTPHALECHGKPRGIELRETDYTHLLAIDSTEKASQSTVSKLQKPQGHSENIQDEYTSASSSLHIEPDAAELEFDSMVRDWLSNAVYDWSHIEVEIHNADKPTTN